MTNAAKATSKTDKSYSNDQLTLFMQQMILEYQSFQASSRSEVRESVAVPVQVTPLDDQFQPAGETFIAVTRDVSIGGIGLFHTQQIETKWLEILLGTPATREKMKVLAEVQHCSPCGPLVLIGCRFC